MSFGVARYWQRIQCMVYLYWLVKVFIDLLCLQCFAISTSTQEESQAVHPVLQWCVFFVPRTWAHWWHHSFFFSVVSSSTVCRLPMMQIYTSLTVYCCQLMIQEKSYQPWHIKAFRRPYVKGMGKRGRRLSDVSTEAVMDVWISMSIQLLCPPVTFSKAYLYYLH